MQYSICAVAESLGSSEVATSEILPPIGEESDGKESKRAGIWDEISDCLHALLYYSIGHAANPFQFL